ncbi:MAG: hypothetical protein HWQ35_32340 [Nostoc sp. NMS1]|uniref:hypothetical protein n=1 Tax=unclassified Nostoc TaxID=2593658 RepID=UPI0025D20742|nr:MULTISPECIES: hypothetical protein [unclassified Nostoc]MBN3911062.1 hypothetical protein [Nostoc sp. NMS1]MBN3990692.1 hypothetical protein [Nostoc sp. NMS2]
MFINELSPIFREFIQHPASFVGGLFSGVLRLNLADDPVKSWLDRQSGSNSYTSTTQAHNGKASGPQQISID